MRRTSRPATVLGAGLVAVLGLASCSRGGATKDNGITAMAPSQIVQQVEHAMDAQQTVHIAGDVQSAGGPSVHLDVVDGQSRGGGTIAIDGSPLDVIVDGGTFFVKGDAGAWTKLTGSTTQSQVLAGKWLKTDTGNPDFAPLAGLLTIPRLVTALGRGPIPTKGSVTKEDGVAVLTLTTTDGTSYVATTGRPLLISSHGNGGSGGSGTLTYDQYNTAALPADPSGAVALGSVGAAGG
jgi:hypothetical protein